MIIKSHKELALHIEGKRIFHCNSLGKDSVLVLEWLTKFAKPSHIESVYSKFFAEHPDSQNYFNYLKKQYPSVKFTEIPDASEVSEMISGWLQSPIEVINFFNNFEYVEMKRQVVFDELRAKYNCDYIADGRSAYEGFGRAIKFHNQGLVQDKRIYPLGLMKKKDVMDLIKKLNLKLHPCYRTSEGSFDHVSYYKMKKAFDECPEFEEIMMKYYPLLRLDKYRYEVLFGKK